VSTTATTATSPERHKESHDVHMSKNRTKTSKKLGDDLPDFDNNNLRDNHLQDDDTIIMTKSQLDDHIRDAQNKSLGGLNLESIAGLTQLLTLLNEAGNSNFFSAIRTQPTFSFPKYEKEDNKLMGSKNFEYLLCFQRSEYSGIHI